MPRNPYVCLAIIISLAVTLLIGTCGMVWLAVLSKEPPSALVAVVSASIGSLSSFLVSVPRGSVGLPEGKT